jgi:hypothetical protein
LWDAAEIIVDEIVVPLAEVGPGEYTLVVGLYDAGTGVRLPIEGSPANELSLQRLTIQ